ncbi:MAG: hypothetical protein Q4E75_01790, partial [bacterium]|nr:hypothetical protein [bacterium]
GTIDKTSETFLTYNDKDTLTYDENRKLIFGEAKTPQVQEKYVYMWYTGGSVNGPSLNSIISPEDYSQTAPTDKNYYLKFKLNNTNIVTNSYACSVHNEVEYCLEGGNQAILYGYAEDPGDYTGNMLILKKLQDLEISCTFGSTYSYCVDGNIVLEETGASVTSRYRDYFCTINDDGSSRCFSMI